MIDEGLLEEFLTLLLPDPADQFVLRIGKAKVMDLLKRFLKDQGIDGDPKHLIDDIEDILHNPIRVSSFMVGYDHISDSLIVEFIPSIPRIERALETLERVIAPDLLKRINNLSPFGFESLIEEVFSRVPWTENVTITLRTKDGGIDFIGDYVDSRSFFRTTLIGEVKHWRKPVGVKPIREFLHVLAQRRTRESVIGVYVSSSGFTKNALKELSRAPVDVLTFDAIKLVQLMIAQNIGVEQFKMEVKAVADQFWDDIEI